MKTVKMFAGYALTLLLALGVQEPAAQARSAPAVAGMPNANTSSSCFYEYYGSITNTCGSAQYWVVPITVDAATTYAPTYNARVPTGGSITCWSAAVSWTGTITTTPAVTRGAGVPTLAPGALTVPVHGSMIGACSLSTNSKLYNVEY